MRMRTRPTLFLVAISLVALAAGCSSTQKDQALATDIKAKMFSDPQVKGASVDVAVKNGEAILSGEVPDDGARYEAFKIATDTPGVKHVVDKMVVQAAEAIPPTKMAPVEPARVDQQRSPKPARKERKHHDDTSVKSVNSEPSQAP